MLGLVNRDSFSNNRFESLHGAFFLNAKNIKSQELWTFEIKNCGVMPIAIKLMNFNLVQ
jgi:hypothetical protein